MTGVAAKDALEMGFVRNKNVVEALLSDRANEPLSSITGNSPEMITEIPQL